MSEYQYYEFQTADRRLSEKEMQELRAYSTRALITATSFSNEYSFGDFRGNVNAWMEKYFDGFVYLANWGTHKFQLALPAGLLALKTAQLYCAGEAASAREKAGKVLLTFCSEEEGGGERVQGEGLLSSLLPLRAELAQGDVRSLYIGWLLNVQAGELENEQTEPSVPPNLGDLPRPLSALVAFLRIDEDLLAVAAEASPRRESRPVQREEMAAWVALLPAQEKDELLVRLMAGEDVATGAELRARFSRNQVGSSPAPEAPRRTVGQLLATAEAFRRTRKRAAARTAAEEHARREQEAAIARQRHLDGLTGRESELWPMVDELVATKLPKSYDLAAQHLLDLRDLAKRKGAEADFSERLARLRQTQARKPSFIARLEEKGL